MAVQVNIYWLQDEHWQLEVVVFKSMLGCPAPILNPDWKGESRSKGGYIIGAMMVER